MSRSLLLCIVLVACGGQPAKHAQPPAGDPPATPAPAPAPVQAAAPAQPAKPAASKQLQPPQHWDEIGHRGQETVVMGSVVWTGGEAVEIDVMGSMKDLLQGQFADAIKAKPDDPGGAIQGVIDMLNDMGGAQKVIEWVRK